MSRPFRLAPALLSSLLALGLPACSCGGPEKETPPDAGSALERPLAVRGLVVDGDEAPVAGAQVSVGEDATQTAADGRFVLAVRAGAPPSVVVRAEGFAKAERQLEAASGPTSAGTIMLTRLTASARVETSGGTVEGEGVRLVVPAGAFPRAVTVEVARIAVGDPLLDDLRLPRPIPTPVAGAVVPLFGLVLEAEGLQPSGPLEVRLASSAGLPEGTRVPVGRYDLATGAWVDVGVATAAADGSLGFAVTHLSVFAGALPAAPSASTTPPELDGLTRVPTPFLRGEPRVDPKTGALQIGVDLPALVRRGEKIGLTLFHDSRTPAPAVVAPALLPEAKPGEELVVQQSSVIGDERALVRVDSAVTTDAPAVVVSDLRPSEPLEVVGPADGTAVPSDFATKVQTGVHRVRTEVVKPAPESVLARSASESFVRPEADVTLLSGAGPVAAPVPAVARAATIQQVAVDNRSDSPFGQGWHLRGLTRLVQPWCSDSRALLAGGYETPAIAFVADTQLLLARLAATDLALEEVATPPLLAFSGGHLYVGLERDQYGDQGAQIWRVAADGTAQKLVGRARSDGGAQTCTAAAADMYLGMLTGLGADPSGDGVIFATRECIVQLKADGALVRIAGNEELQGPGPGPGSSLAEVTFGQELMKVEVGRKPGTFYINSYIAGDLLVQGGVIEPLRTRVSHPHGLTAAIDVQGQLYYTVVTSPCLYRWEDGLNDPPVFPSCSAGTPVVLADGPAELAKVGQIAALASDTDGNLWILDGTFHAVRRLAPDGTVVTVAGGRSGATSGLGGSAAQATLGDVFTLAVGTPDEVALGQVGAALRLVPAPRAALQGLAAGDQSTLTLEPDGSWRRVLADAIEERYDANGLLLRRGRPGAPGLEFAYFEWKTPPKAQACGTPAPVPLLKSIRFAGEELFKFEWNGSSLSAVSDAAGRRTTVEWDGAQVRRLAPPGGGVSFRYDAEGHVVERSSPGPTGSPVAWKYTYGAGRLVKATVPGRGELVFESAEGAVAIAPEKVSAAGIARAVTAGPAVSTLSTRTGGTAKVALGSNVLRVSNPAGDTTALEMDALGRLVRERRPDGAELVYTRNRTGSIVELFNATTGDRWRYAYDPLGRLEYRTDPSGYQTHYSYDSAGRLAARFEPGATSTRFTYESSGAAIGLPTRVTDGLERAATFEYDAKGNLVRTHTPGAGVTEIARDAVGRAIRVTEPSGLVRQTRYDERDGIVEQKLGEAPDAPAVAYRRVIAEGWESEGSHVPGSAMTGATDELGRDWSFSRDDAFQILRTQTPGEGLVEQAFDAKGRRIRRATVDGSAEETEWDEQGRVARRYFTGPAAGADVRFTYDALGRVSELRDLLLLEQREFGPAVGWTGLNVGPTGSELGETARFQAYRTRPSASTETQAMGATRYLLTRDWDGQVAKVEVEPAQVQGTRRQVLAFAFDAARKLTTLTRGNGTQTTRTYDAEGRVATQSEVTPSGTVSLSFTYDSAGRPLTRTVGGTVRTFGYDAQGRLASCSDTAESYAYDASGARTSGGGRAYLRDGRGRLLSDGARDYGSDAQGRRTSSISKTDAADAWTLVWGAGGLLAEVKRGTTSVASYRYDGSGRRVQRTTAAGSWHYGYLPDSDRPLRIVEPGGTEWHLVHAWKSAPFTLATSTTGKERYVHLDPFERVLGLSDETGKLTLLDEECYGVRRAPVALTGPQVGFHGQPYDEETGLYAAGPRYYDPAVGEFLSSDPAGLEAGTDPWGYAGGNPVLKADPSGRLFFVAAGAFLVGAAIFNEIRSFAQSREVARAKKSTQDLTDFDLDDDDSLKSAEDAHKNLYKAADKGGDTAIECVKKGVEGVTNPTTNAEDLIDQAKGEVQDAVSEAIGEATAGEEDPG